MFAYNKCEKNRKNLFNMKNLFLISLLFLIGCTSPRYIYVVDDVYYSTGRTYRQQPPNFNKIPHRSMMTVPPYVWRHRMSAPPRNPFITPRKVELESYRSQFAPPPPPPQIEKKEEVKEEAKKEAPVRKFKK